MTCDELKDDYAAYALGVLDGPELDELREHLARECQNCTPGVRGAQGLVARMATAVTQVDPPKRLRARVIALVSPDKRGSFMNWTLAFVTALSVMFSVHIWLRHSEMHQVFIREDQKWRQQNAELARLNETLALLEDPAAREVTFGKGARGRVVISPRHGVAFSGQNMASLAPGKTYEMWIIPKGGKPVPAGTFAPSADGSALHLQPGPVDLASTAAVAVSIEQEGGVASPTADQIIIVAPVGQ
jgi:anti-sigma-K factor RskA